MKALVTGASGFVGSGVVRRLLAAGHGVRALVRPTSDLRNLAGLKVTPVEGDLRDPSSLERAASGCQAVFHVAAEYRLWHPKPREIYAANVDGTRNVLNAAAEAGVERVVYTSSVATLGLDPSGKPADEQIAVTLEDMVGDYKRSKFLAEQEALQFAREGLDVVIVNPTAPVGARDLKPTPTGRTILDAAAGRMPAYVDTGLNLVHVDDVAAGHLLAFERGRAGERYILGQSNMTLKQILDQVALLSGRTPPRFELSPDWLLPLAYVAQGWARVTGSGEPRITVAGLRMSKKRMFFSAAKAERELGFAPRPALEGLRDALSWFRSAGYLNGRGHG